ncbi:glycosyltransferase [Roseibium sp.]|uniref:glycosyltransferase n=1 Tax=Roseibium sp. TaxID=1936156 RepID=UPI003BAA0E29
MMDLLANPDRRAQMAAYATDRAQREFHWDIEKHSMLDAYRTLLQPKAPEKIENSLSVSQ